MKKKGRKNEEERIEKRETIFGPAHTAWCAAPRRFRPGRWRGAPLFTAPRMQSGVPQRLAKLIVRQKIIG
jgi:hypothetical protein